MRVLIAAVTAATLLATSALGADLTAPTSGPLAPGKPAGVKQAQISGPVLYWALGLGLLIGTVVILSDNGKSTPVSTGTTP